jgi:hypothetical protein
MDQLMDWQTMGQTVHVMFFSFFLSFFWPCIIGLYFYIFLFLHISKASPHLTPYLLKGKKVVCRLESPYRLKNYGRNCCHQHYHSAQLGSQPELEGVVVDAMHATLDYPDPGPKLLPPKGLADPAGASEVGCLPAQVPAGPECCPEFVLQCALLDGSQDLVRLEVKGEGYHQVAHLQPQHDDH